MIVHVDGEIYNWQSTGGISRIFTESLLRAGSISSDLEVRLSVSTSGATRSPRAPWIKTECFNGVPSIAQRLWRKIRPAQIFHSTFFTLSPRRDIPSVVTVYDFILESNSALCGIDAHVAWRKDTSLRAADMIISISEATAEATLERSGRSRDTLRVIYPGVGETFLSAPRAEQDVSQLESIFGPNRRYWLFVGDRSGYKNFGMLLETFARIAQETDTHLVVVGGNAKLDPWQSHFIIKQRLIGRVHLLGKIEDELLKVLYARSLAFVFPSLTEGFGIPLLEAMACRTTVIASDIPVFREIGGEYPIYFDPQEEDALIEALRKQAGSSAQSSRLEKAAAHAGQFNWDVAAKKLVEVYQELT